MRELRDAQDQLELASREECRATASVEVREFIARTASNSDEDVSFTEIRYLYQELGRLAGPMQIIEEQGGGEVVSEAVKVITAAYAERTRKERKFDNATATFVTLAWRDRETERLDAMLEEVEKARDLYFADFPLGAPLPQDEGERGKEEERRASQRVLAIQRATKAIQELVAPLRAQWMARLVAAEEISARLEERRSASGSLRPEAQKYGVSPRGAEYWVADAMRWLGAHDAEVTQQSQDGGVDVITGRFAVSVKHYAGSVPVEEIREIFGVAITMRKLPILWTSGTLTKAASDFADLAPVAVVQYRVEDASVTGLNEAGRELLAAGVGDEHESLPPTI